VFATSPFPANPCAPHQRRAAKARVRVPMRVGINDAFHTFARRVRPMPPVQIQPARIAVNSIHVPVAAHASITAGRFTGYGSRSSSSRPVGWPRMWTNGFSAARNQPFRVLRLAAAGNVQAGDHHVQFRQHHVVKIQAFLQNVHLRPRQQPEFSPLAGKFFVQLADFFDLLPQPFASSRSPGTTTSSDP